MLDAAGARTEGEERQQHEQRDRQDIADRPGQIALADDPQVRVDRRDGDAAGDPQHGAAKGEHAAKGDDEARDADIGDDPADHQTSGDAEQHHRCDGVVKRPPPPHVEHRGDAAEEARQRADRQVDFSGDDDEHHPARQHAGNRHLPEQIGEVARGEELRHAQGVVVSQRPEEGPDDRDDEQQGDDLVFGDQPPNVSLGGRRCYGGFTTN